MQRPAVVASVIIGKLVALLARITRLGGGTQLPGRVALRLCPDLVAVLARQLPRGVAVVTATNGKTTTTRLVAAGLAAAGIRIVYNPSGANMAAGVATALVADATCSGRPRAVLGLFEVDEGSVPAVVPELAPRAVLVGNFFRDQLDRYGEVAVLARRVGEALAALPPGATLVMNADDPLVTAAAPGDGALLDVRWFGLDDAKLSRGEEQTEADIRHCPRCRAPLAYRQRVLGHLGDWRCPACKFARPRTGYRVGKVRRRALEGQSFVLSRPGLADEAFDLPLPGDHALYNAAGALALLDVLGVPPGTLRATVAVFRPPYGRFERFELAGHPAWLMLVKNPAGANVTLRMLAPEAARRGKARPAFAFWLNDLAADGRDVSWIWDAHFELLGAIPGAVAGGRRAEDMALRLAYAGVPEGKIAVVHGWEASLDRLLADAAPGAPLYLVATYTAMHEVRAALAKRTGAGAFWKEGR